MDAVTQMDHVTLKRINHGPLFVGNNYSATNMVDQYQASRIYTNTSNSLVLDAGSNGTNLVTITNGGAVTGGTYNGQTISSAASFTGTVAAASTIQGTRLISTIATGTAPLTVTSTTKVDNLNVDLLDGLDSSVFVQEIATKDDLTVRVDSGFYESSSATTAEGFPETDSWYHILANTHSNTANNYSMQFAGDFFNSNDLFYRATMGSGTTAWNRVWHQGNDGSGSGQDADLLDGLNSTAFALASGDGDYIQNTTVQQTSSNFNISGAGVIGTTLNVAGASTLSGNVGIGGASVSHALDVNGNARLQGGNRSFIFNNGSVETSITQAAGATAALYTGGNFGVGIAVAPDTKLEVRGATLNSDAAGAVNYYRNVAHAYLGAGTQTGTLKIALPTSWTDTMLSFTIKGYDYSGYGAWEAVVSGYNCSCGWINTSAEIRGKAPFTQVRLAHDGTKNVILLGGLTTAWNYASVEVTDVAAGYNAKTGWGSGWAISLLTAETGIANINTPLAPILIGGAGNVSIGAGLSGRTLDVYSNIGNNGDGLAIGQDTDNSQTIQAYIDNQWTNRATYASGCCNLLKLQPDVGSVQIGSASNPTSGLAVTGITTSTSFSGAGTGLTGTAASLNIGGNAGTVTDGMYLSATQYPTGVKYFQSNKGAASTLGANNTYTLEAFSSDGGAAAMSFHRGGAYAVNFGLDPDNVLRIGGWSAAANLWQLDMSGNETLAGSLTSASTLQGTRLISTVATGTAPLTVASTTMVTNLNSQYLQGATPSMTAGSNTIVQRNAGGYVFANYFNTTADVTAVAASHFAIQTGSDNYIRWQTPANVRTSLGLTAGGAGDIWVDEAGDTMTGLLSITAAGTGLSVTNNATIGGTLNVTGNATFDTNTLQVVASTDKVLIGTATGYADTKLEINRALTVAVANLQYGGYSSIFAGVADTGDKTGFAGRGFSTHTTGTVDVLMGVSGATWVQGSGGTVTNAYGFWARNDTSAGATISNAIGLRVANSNGAGTVTQQFGIYIDPLTKGSTDVGVYIGGADTYALWVDSGISRFDDDIQLTSTFQDIIYTPNTSSMGIVSNNGIGIHLDANNDGNGYLQVVSSSYSNLLYVDEATGVSIDGFTQYTQRLCHSGANVAFINDVILGDCNAAGQADIAEFYDTPGGLEPGDVIAPAAGNMVDKTSTVYQSSAIGVVSTNPVIDGILGHRVTSPNRQPIGLAGRVPVKVSLENGPIAAGDHLAPASIPGFAMKATGSGRVIGVALEDYSSTSPRVSSSVAAEEVDRDGHEDSDLPQYRSNPSSWPTDTGKIMMFVNPSFYHPQVSNLLQGDSLSVTGSTSLLGDVQIGASLNVTGPTTLSSLTVTGNVNIQQDLVVLGNTTVQDITVNGKIISAGVAATAALGAQTNGAGTIIISGNDTAGTVSYTAGAEALAGEQAKVVFSSPYGAQPRVTLTPTSADAAQAKYYVTRTTDGFEIVFIEQPVDGAVYSYDYQIIQ
ncbi:MAG: hypothetical protein M3Q70_03545 [bacterium]|nr:hypothetical protein [bacterium]